MRRPVVLLLAVSLLAGGCGGDNGGGGDPTPSPSPTTTSASPTTTLTTTTSTPTKTKQKKPRNIIAWILDLAPGAPTGPPEFAAYRAVRELRCEEVFPRLDDIQNPASRRLYGGAAQACLAAFRGQRDRWPEAQAAYAEAKGNEDGLSCMDVVVLKVLGQLVSAHQQNPSGSFQRSNKGTWMAPPCPAISRIEPDHGVEGTTVTSSAAT